MLLLLLGLLLSFLFQLTLLKHLLLLLPQGLLLW